ncbi:hypothetical protein SCNU_04711 [Gordonia neofelifaecis NRRL B-59395]|uniref:Lipoprotein n=1 Tax=Gordonia neofelifaecis NRRL B-59395 TaxID=644548 RepID=F1YGB3_9ACTN|nr:hypothetical protein SCNU_04711 [Gordonia neofelifaecis NRRL B-59395]
MRATAVALLGAVSVATLGACTLDGAPVRAPVSIDAGRYPTSPGPAEPDAATPGAVARLQSIRLADHVILTDEADPAFTSTSVMSIPLTSMKKVDLLMPGTEHIGAADAYRYGFSTVASDPKAPESSISHAVLAFADSASASAAAAQLAAAGRRASDGRTGVPIAGLPASAQVAQGPSAGVAESPATYVSMAFTPIGDTVVYTRVQDRSADRSRKVVVAAYDKQRAMLAGYRPDPGSEVDPHGLLRATLPDRSNALMAHIVVGRRGEAHFYDEPSKTLRTLEDLGIAESAKNLSQVYRAGSTEKARAWQRYLETSYAVDRRQEAAAPLDLPGVGCFYRRSSSVVCLMTVGEYVAEISATKLTDAHQQASAQYLILKKM